MSYVKEKIPDTVYHLTKRKNLQDILDSECIRRFADRECWFCRSIPDMLRYMDYTVLCEGKPYIDVDGGIKRYPKFVPEDYVLLKLTPRYREGNWYRWEQELPPGASAELKAQGREFSALKIGYRGDLRFKDAQVIELSEVMKHDTPTEARVQAEEETNQMLLAEDAVETAVYLANAPDCCSGDAQLGNVLGMLGANIADEDIYHSEDQHPKMTM